MEKVAGLGPLGMDLSWEAQAGCAEAGAERGGCGQPGARPGRSLLALLSTIGQPTKGASQHPWHRHPRVPADHAQREWLFLCTSTNRSYPSAHAFLLCNNGAVESVAFVPLLPKLCLLSFGLASAGLGHGAALGQARS